MSGWSWVLAAGVLLAVIWTVVLNSARVRRLHRLHIRTDAARHGLESALDRRAVAALTVAEVLARTPDDGPDGIDGGGDAGYAAQAARLRAAVVAARSVPVLDAARETAENLLGRRLGVVDRMVLPAAVLEELVDAEQLLILARRVHNDAVRDTLALRSRRLVRWLHLAGTAAVPAYFEIADPEPGVTTAVPPRLRERPVAPPR